MSSEDRPVPASVIDGFISRWSAASPSERANAQLFLSELCDALGVPRPDPSPDFGYSFEFTFTRKHIDGSSSENRIDLYKRGCFVLEAKHFQPYAPPLTDLQLAVAEVTDKKKRAAKPTRGSKSWDDAMGKARGQAEGYIRALPASEPTPPFLIVVDVGDTFELFSDFTQAGKAYLPFPHPGNFRLKLEDLRYEEIRDRLRLVWTNPTALDPAKHSAAVTREVSGHLATLASSLEAAGHSPSAVAEFLTRCLFCMFAEDVGLLPDPHTRGFSALLESMHGDPAQFVPVVSQLFRDMDKGTGTEISIVLRRRVLQFNGGLFENPVALPINKDQLILLQAASAQDWKSVEPSIFGTLLERALNPQDRHKLGAHYTPRAYVERLVLPAVMEPLRADWDAVRVAAYTLANKGQADQAIAEVRGFHRRLCETRVLDPACGSGNFLYVTFEHMKRLEGEVLDELRRLGDIELTIELEKFTVGPHQFFGLEINPRAASIAELVLWIGYLQWHFRTRGQTMPAEPVLRKFHNIECRDAVLAYDGEPQPKRDAAGNVLTVWDRRSEKADPVTGRMVPDDTQRVGLLTYSNPRPATWPEADFVVGNPPFLGATWLRAEFGDGYAETLRATYPDVPESVDFVLYWWHKAAGLVRAGRLRRFGLITTNSLRQTFSRRVTEAHLSGTPPLSLVFAIPDHPWVDTADGAAVRIAMTVGAVREQAGELLEVVDELPQEDGSSNVTFATRQGCISADLTTGADVAGTLPLQANDGLCNRGFCLFGSGFVVSQEQAVELGLGRIAGLETHIRPYRNGRDLTSTPRGVLAIDLFGLSADEVRRHYPETYQHVVTYVKPERDQNSRESRRLNWWVFGEPNKLLRRMLEGLPRYIATVETAKHRVFQFLDAEVLPDNKLVVIALDDAYCLGVLSSRSHAVYALAAGSWLGVGNDPVYVKSRCFDPFPFPACNEATRERIRQLAEELDTHRKRVQSQHPGLALTAMYNVMEKLRANEPLTPKDKQVHASGLISVLRQLHDELDAAVFDAYGWPSTLTDEEILDRIVALNAERAQEEVGGFVRWLRPEYQVKVVGGASRVQGDLSMPETKKTRDAAKASNAKRHWPKSLPERVGAVEAELKSLGSVVTPEQVAKRFRYAKAADVAQILETLCLHGRIHRGSDADHYIP